MNWILLGITAAVAGVTLTSCGGMSGGQTVDEPTTEQMNQLESQWGLPPRKGHSRNATSPSGDYPANTNPESSAPVQVETAPAPAAPQPAPPPPPEPEPPKLDAGTIKKLQ
jgi:hypothetical protein